MTAGEIQAQDGIAFDRMDRLSRAVIGQIRCGQHLGTLRRNGELGPIDSLGHRGQCKVVDGKYVGLFFDSDTSFARVTRFSAIDFATSTPRTAPLDTASILAVERASRTAQIRGESSYYDAKRQYTPVALQFDGDTIEVWLIPATALYGTGSGGERGYEFSPDGRTLLRELDSFDALETVTIPETGTVRIASRQAELPLLTELMLANALHEKGRAIEIAMKSETVALDSAENAPWVHIANKK